jgi:L-ascorbate metabolism protein UlaG (beta-lactamase superfamily)
MLENVHWLGHASFKLTGEKVVYIDPWQLHDGEPADIILITHGHYDHCSAEDVAKIRRPSTVVVAPVDCADKLPGPVQVVKPGDKLTVAGVKIEAVPAYNIDKTFHPRKENWVGYVVTLNGQRIYHAGDTDHIPEMDSLKVDVALLPAGGKYTMTASEAAAAANAFKPRVAVPMHWGTIVGSDEDAARFRQLSQVPVEILRREGSSEQAG